MIVPDMNDLHEAEAIEYEYHRLMGIAEAFTGADKLRQALPKPSLEAVEKIQRFIDEEQAMRDLTPYTVEDMKRKVDMSVSKDDYYERNTPSGNA